MKKFFLVLLSVFVLFGFIACSRGSGSSASAPAASAAAPAPAVKEGEFELKIGGGHAPTSSLTICWNEVFVPRVEELSKKRIKVLHFENDQLGVEVDRTEQVQLGVIQMTYVSEAAASINPKMNIFPLPFLFRDEDHYDKVLDGPVGKKLVEDFPNYGLHPLGFFENGFRVITNSKRPVNSFSDMAGLKIRVSQSPIPIALFTAFGANTVAMSFGELYSALQTGTVDGQENAFNTVASAKLYEVQKYFAETNHMMGSFCIVASENWWKTLPRDMQEVIETAARETSAFQRKLYRDQVAVDKKTLLDNGMQGTAPDVTEFAKASEKVYADFFAKYPEYKALVDEIRAVR